MKYLTRRWEGEVNGEAFALKNHGAQDVRAYDVINDVVRLEKITEVVPNSAGVLIRLSNDPMYWTAPGHQRLTNADAFRLNSGRVISGLLSWREGTGGTMKGRETAHDLRGSYLLDWRPYSTHPGLSGRFQQLIVQVPSDS